MGNGSGTRLLRGLAWIGAVLIVVVVAGWWFRQRRAAAALQSERAILTCAVQEGPLVISVTEPGTIKPRETIVLKSQLEGRSTILFLVPEGRQAEKGDLLVELDVTALQDARVEQDIRVRNGDAAFVSSRENLEVVKNQARSDVEKAELALRFAKEDVRNYKDGEYPNQQTELKGRIALSEEEVQRKAESEKWSQQLFNEKYVSETELQADRLAAQKAKLDLDLARNQLKLLEEFTYTRQLDKLTSDVTQFEMALERTRTKSASNVTQAEADLAARESEFSRQKDKLQKLDEQIGKAKITAPASGVVVYATSTQFSFRGNVEPLAEGQEVHERQELIYLPTADTFMATVKVHESSLKKIYAGLPVRVTVDALPGRELTGTVAKIAPMPDAQSMFMNPDLKVYATEIHIDGGGDVLRTGMTCASEIVVARYEKALFVPVQCVVRANGKPLVHVRANGVTTPREVEIGMDNNRMVHVLSGLKAGESVLMTPPLDGTTALDRPAPIGDVPIPPRPTAEVRPNGGARPAGPGQGPAGGRGEGVPKGPAEGAQAEGDLKGPAEAPAEGGRPAMTPEAMARMKERFEKMTPEEREAARAQFGQRRRSREQPGAAPGAAPAVAPP
jgi:HlyD family secretion protein